MSSLSGASEHKSADDPKQPSESKPSPQFQQHASPRFRPAAAQHVSESTSGCEEAGTVAVHKFPVDKQLLLQMRFKQMSSRTSASLVTTPAKAMPTRSMAAGMVSPSHVGPPVPSMKDTNQLSILSDAAEGTQLTASKCERQDAIQMIAYPQNPAARWPDRPLPDVPQFKHLRSQCDVVMAQQAEGIGALVQHDIADPDVYFQWPESTHRQLPLHEAHPIPMQQLHSLQQPLPSYAWSTEQLTAIASAAATAAITAVRHQSVLAAATANPAEHLQLNRGAMSEPKVRPNLQTALTLPSLHPIVSVVDARQVLTDTSMLAQPQHEADTDSAAVNEAQQASVPQHAHLQRPQLLKDRHAAPKQADALRKLKHRNSVGRASTGQVPDNRPASLGLEPTARSAESALLEQSAVNAGKIATQPAITTLPQQHAVRFFILHDGHQTVGTSQYRLLRLAQA